LDPAARRVLAVAAIGGPVFDLKLIESLTELPRTAVEEALAAAERRHLVVFDGSRYAYSAPLVAEVVRRECLTAGQRQSLSRRAVALLDSRADFESRLLRAELRARVEPGEDSFGSALALGREAEAARAFRGASRALAAAQLASGKSPTAAQEKQMQALREAVARRT
jgi:hypothetical protein